MTRHILRLANSVISSVFAAVVMTSASHATVSLVATTDTLPLSTLVGTPYSGRFACYNAGTENIANVNCTVSGLPAWATVGACSQPLPVASLPAPPPGLFRLVGSITCPVTGTPTNSGSFNITVTATGTGVSSTAQATLKIFAVPTELSATVDLPAGIVGQRWSGSYTCDSVGTVNPLNRLCTVTGLPSWVTRQCFPVSGNFVLCVLSGTPTGSGSSSVTVTTSASNASSASATSVLQISELQVPTLDSRLLFLLSLALVMMAYPVIRRNSRRRVV